MASNASCLLTLLVLAVTAVAAYPDIVQMSIVEDNARPNNNAPLIGQNDGHDFSFAHIKEEWEKFKTSFEKKYESIKEELQRMAVFRSNLAKINEHNMQHKLGRKSYRLGVNAYADLTSEEFRQRMTCYQARRGPTGSTGGITYISPAVDQQLPKSVDWRKKGAVTPVKDQGSCGSCWSFSTTGSLEGQNFRKTGQLLSFSEQQLVDCSGKYGNLACNGGLMDNAFNYIKKYGIELESAYPYKARKSTCRYSKGRVVANCTGFVDIPQGSESKLQEAVANVGPVSVAIDASHSSFQLYSDGIYDEPECSSTKLDHGVLVVGYGSEDGNDYWLVKNSWNTHWGDEGYIKMARNKRNQCGIASSASYPTV